MARGKVITTPSTASSAASTPAPATSSTRRKRRQSTDQGSSDVLDIDGTDTEVDTPTRPSKKQRGQTTHEKATHFRAGFPPESSNEDVLSEYRHCMLFIV